MPIVLALSGKRGVGKTTSANYLERFYGIKKLSFSTRLKELCKILFPDLTESDLDGSTKENPCVALGNQTPRELMIKFGQFVRYWDTDYWIKQIAKRHESRINYVIDDLRYPNEAACLKSFGSKLVRINRYPSLNPYKNVIEDVSETGLDSYGGFDFIVNDVDNTNLSELYNSISRIMDKLGYTFKQYAE